MPPPSLDRRSRITLARITKEEATKTLPLVEDILAPLLEEPLATDLKALYVRNLDLESLAEVVGPEKADLLVQQGLQALQAKGYSLLGNGRLVRFLRACADYPLNSTVALSTLIHHRLYEQVKDPWREVHTGTTLAERASFINLLTEPDQRLVSFVKPFERLQMEQAQREALGAYFQHLLSFKLTAKQRRTLELLGTAVDMKRADQTLHHCMKELLTGPLHGKRLTSRQATLFLDELDRSLQRKLKIGFRLTALDAIPGPFLTPEYHPELYPGYVLDQIEILVADHLAEAEDPMKTFEQMVNHLRRRLLAPKPRTAEERRVEAYFDWKREWQKVGGLAQTLDLKAHELLLLQAVSDTWKGEPLSLAELKEPYRAVCHQWSVAASEGSAVYKYAVRLSRAGYLAKVVGQPRRQHTAARHVSYYTLQDEKARGPLEKLEALRDKGQGRGKG